MKILGFNFLSGTKYVDTLEVVVAHLLENRAPRTEDAIKDSIIIKSNPKRALKVKSKGGYFDYLLEPIVEFTPANPDSENVKLHGFRHLGFASYSSIGEFGKYVSLSTNPQFREFFNAHCDLFKFELLTQYIHLLNALLDRNDAPDPRYDEGIESSIRIINRHSDIITPVYDIQDVQNLPFLR